MNSISLYGHLTTDTIFDGNITYNSVGGLGNVWFMLSKICKNYQVNVEPTNVGEALILVNKDKAERSSIANLNKIQRTPVIKDSEWSHILYVNELEDISFIKDVKNKSKIVSIDICKGKPFKQFDILKYVDYFFISDEDLFMDVNELAKKVKGWVILHHKSGSRCVSKDKIFDTSTPVIDGINVLGAGDMFAAATINCILNTVDKSNLENNIKEAHSITSRILAEINEKN
jgi:sugar/nucleoside kinase (ribokinase family)|tara:strand:+ start:415 stop:1104 length:690 start_codon:yes stop_codon:yes gene_type:complete